MSLPRERSQTLQHLRGILPFVQINRQKPIMRRHTEGWHLACFEKVADILHLNERHRYRLVLDARVGYDKIDEFAQCHAIFECFQEVARFELLVQCRFDPRSDFAGRLWCVATHSQVAHVLVE